MRIEAWLRRLLYATLAALFASGLAWWCLEDGAPARPYLIALHGLSAMLSLLALGAIAVLHVRESWRRKRNRGSGVIAATALGILVLSAFGLYYIGWDWLRSYTSLVHLIVGLVMPLLVLIHVVLGTRSRPKLDDDLL